MRSVWIGLACALVGGTATAADSWREVGSAALGLSASFPAAPSAVDGAYATELVKTAPSHRLSAATPTGRYVLMVVDLPQQKEDGAIILGEAEFWLTFLGDVTLNNVARINAQREYGRFISIHCRDDVVPEGPDQTVRAHRIWKDAAGLECPPGGRLIANLFFVRGRLVLAAGINLPGPDGSEPDSPGALRFAQSLSGYRSEEGGAPR